MVANVDNSLASGLSDTFDHSLYPYRESEVVRTTQIAHPPASPFGERPKCSPRNCCRKLMDCQACHDRHKAKQARRVRKQVDHLLASHPPGSVRAVILRFSPLSSNVTAGTPLELQLGLLNQFMARLQRQRSLAVRRKKRAGFAHLHYMAMYPHFRADGNYFVHCHAVAVVSSEFDYQLLSSLGSATGIEVYPEAPEDMKGGYIEYMFEEFQQGKRTLQIEGQERSGLALLSAPIALCYCRCRGRLLRQTGTSRTRRLSQQEQAESERYRRLSIDCTNYAPLQEVSILWGNTLRARRIGEITRVIQAAYNEARELGQTQFPLSNRQLAKLFNTTEGTIRKDLAQLEQHGIIHSVYSTGNQAKEYTLGTTESYSRNDANVDNATQYVRSNGIDSQGPDSNQSPEARIQWHYPTHAIESTLSP